MYKFLSKTKNTQGDMLLLLIALLFASIAITILKPLLGIFFLVLTLIVFLYTLKIRSIKIQESIKDIKNLSHASDEVMKISLKNTPIPICVIEFDGKIKWYNSRFAKMIDGGEILGNDISDLIEGISLRKNLNEREEMYSDLIYKDRKYTVVYNVIKTFKDEIVKYRMVLYWIDKTDQSDILELYENNKNVIALIDVDAYEDVIKSVDEEDRPRMKMDVENILSDFGESVNGALLKINKSSYALIFNKKMLVDLKVNKFSILDEIRAIEHGSGLPLTISIGVGFDGEDIAENYEFATAALDLALGRGGDQVVVKTKDDFSFYGGKSKAVEKKNKVKSRLIGHALKQLVNQSPNVLIMGHNFPDMDAMGAAVGIYDICKNCGAEANIILNSTNVSIEIFTDLLAKDDYYSDMFVNHDQALEKCSKDTLVVVVDTHRPSYTEFPQILEKTDKKVVIDHHRRGIDFIDDAVLQFHEVYASSTCEMVTELIQYIDIDFKINKLTAKGLMGGIFLDTKNFAFKTGIRTFEAATFLRSLGANTTDVKSFFNNDLEDCLAKADIIKNTKIIKDKICISYPDREVKNINLVIAQSADELLNIKDVEASFVLGSKRDKIYISARSLGNVNVHVMMEKIGGGGHLDVAGAQLENTSLEEAYNKVKSIIEEYLKEEEDESNIS